MGLFELIGLGYDSYKNAQEWSEYGVKCVKEKEKVLKKRQKATESKVKELDNMKLGIWQSFSEFVDLFESISNKPAHLEGGYTKENIDLSKEELKGLRLNASVAGEILIGTAEGAVKGAVLGGVAAGATVVAGAVGTMGLTWVGIEGGFTVATQIAQTSAMLKTTLFTPFSAFVIPAAIVTAVSLYNSTIKSIDKAYDIYFQSLDICRKYGEALDRLYKIDIYCDEFQDEIDQTNKMYQFRLGRLKEIAQAKDSNYLNFSDEEKYVLESTILLLKYLKAVISEPIFKTKEGKKKTEEAPETIFNEHGVRRTLETARVQRWDLMDKEKSIVDENSENCYKVQENYIYKVTKSKEKEVLDTERDGGYLESGRTLSYRNMHVKLTDQMTIEGRAYFENCLIEAAVDYRSALQVSDGYCVFKNCEFVISTIPKWCFIHAYGGTVRFENCKFRDWEIGQGTFEQEGANEEHQCFIAGLSDYAVKSYVIMERCEIENGKGRFVCAEDLALVEMKDCQIKNHVGTVISSDGCESSDSTGIRMMKCRFDGCVPRDEKESYLIHCTYSQITAEQCEFNNGSEGYLLDTACETVFTKCTFSDLKPEIKKFKDKYAINFGYKAIVMNCFFSDISANVFMGSHDSPNPDSTCKFEHCTFERVKGEVFLQRGHILGCKFNDCVGYVDTYGSIARNITMVNCYDKDRKKNSYISRGTNLEYSYRESAEKRKEYANIESVVNTLENVTFEEAKEYVREICDKTEGTKGVDLVHRVLALYYPKKTQEFEYMTPIMKKYLKSISDTDVECEMFSWNGNIDDVENGDIPLLLVKAGNSFKWIFTEEKLIFVKDGVKKEWLLNELMSFSVKDVITGSAMGFSFHRNELYAVIQGSKRELVDDNIASSLEAHITGVNSVIKGLKNKESIVEQTKAEIDELVKGYKEKSAEEIKVLLKKLDKYPEELVREYKKEIKALYEALILEEIKVLTDGYEEKSEEELTALFKELGAYPKELVRETRMKIKSCCKQKEKARLATEVEAMAAEVKMLVAGYEGKTNDQLLVLLEKLKKYPKDISDEYRQKVEHEYVQRREKKKGVTEEKKQGKEEEKKNRRNDAVVRESADVLMSTGTILGGMLHTTKETANKQSVSKDPVKSQSVSVEQVRTQQVRQTEPASNIGRLEIETKTEQLVESKLSKADGNYLPGLCCKGNTLFQGNIRKVNAFIRYVENDEFPLLVYDSTVFLNCKKGFLLTNKRVYNLAERTSVKVNDIVGVNGSNPSYMSFELGDKRYYSVKCDISNEKKRTAFAEVLHELIGMLKSNRGEPSIPKEAVTKAKFCGKCGAPVKEGAFFCGKCGNKL